MTFKNQNLQESIISLTDSYKVTHFPQYPNGTEKVISYLESRGGYFDETVYYGVNIILKKYLVGKVITQEAIDQAEEFFEKHFMGRKLFNKEGWQYILDKYDGRLPIKIKSVKEGSIIPTSNVMMVVENTDKKVFWLTNYIESILLQSWYPITVATQSYKIRKLFTKYLETTTSYSKKEIDDIVIFMLQDFGFRGASSVETASIGGSGHLLSFHGTDNISSILTAQNYYNTDEMLGYSIPASEHSTITAWTEAHELDAFENMLDTYKEGLVACVSDSYDIINAVSNFWGEKLKNKITSRNGVLIIRPDSGDPVETNRELLNIIWEKFGGHVNKKGFKVIDSHVRLIQGDGVNYESIIDILDMMVEEKFSIENMAFGMGGALLQKIDRDTQKFAFKACSIVCNGTEVDVQKRPLEITSDGRYAQSFKRSKKGNLKLIRSGNSVKTIQMANSFDDDLMIPIFENGELLKDYNFEDIRNRMYK